MTIPSPPGPPPLGLLDEALDRENVESEHSGCEHSAKAIRRRARARTAARRDGGGGLPVDDPAGGGRYVQLAAEGDDREAGRNRQRAGAEIGGWRLIERIGRGGMGEVYLGERAGTDFRQRAAVKFWLRKRSIPELRSRLRGWILAALAHDGIRRFLDGGIGADLALYLAPNSTSPASRCSPGAGIGARRSASACGLADVDAVEHAHSTRRAPRHQTVERARRPRG